MGAKTEPTRHSLQEFQNTQTGKKMLLVGREKNKYPARQCKVCVADKGVVLRNTTQ
jgi:hypothetical protein